MKEVRDGKICAPTCPHCGCRLKKMEECNHLVHHNGNSFTGRDARGCKCPLLFEAMWVENGRVYHGLIGV